MKLSVLKGSTKQKASTLNDGILDWVVPAEQTLGSDYRVSVTSIDYPTITDSSNADFAIAAGTLGQYTLTVNIMGKGTVTKNPDKPYYVDGEVVTLTAIPYKAGTEAQGYNVGDYVFYGWGKGDYVFDGWGDDKVVGGDEWIKGNTTTATIKGDTVVYANFAYVVNEDHGIILTRSFDGNSLDPAENPWQIRSTASGKNMYPPSP